MLLIVSVILVIFLFLFGWLAFYSQSLHNSCNQASALHKQLTAQITEEKDANKLLATVIIASPENIQLGSVIYTGAKITAYLEQEHQIEIRKSMYFGEIIAQKEATHHKDILVQIKQIRKEIDDNIPLSYHSEKVCREDIKKIEDNFIFSVISPFVIPLLGASSFLE